MGQSSPFCSVSWVDLEWPFGKVPRLKEWAAGGCRDGGTDRLGETFRAMRQKDIFWLFQNCASLAYHIKPVDSENIAANFMFHKMMMT